MNLRLCEKTRELGKMKPALIANKMLVVHRTVNIKEIKKMKHDLKKLKELIKWASYCPRWRLIKRWKLRKFWKENLGNPIGYFPKKPTLFHKTFWYLAHKMSWFT